MSAPNEHEYLNRSRSPESRGLLLAAGSGFRLSRRVALGARPLLLLPGPKSGAATAGVAATDSAKALPSRTAVIFFLGRDALSESGLLLNGESQGDSWHGLRTIEPGARLRRSCQSGRRAGAVHRAAPSRLLRPRSQPTAPNRGYSQSLRGSWHGAVYPAVLPGRGSERGADRQRRALPFAVGRFSLRASALSRRVARCAKRLGLRSRRASCWERPAAFRRT